MDTNAKAFRKTEIFDIFSTSYDLDNSEDSVAAAIWEEVRRTSEIGRASEVRRALEVGRAS